jgi:hypothetical protein
MLLTKDKPKLSSVIVEKLKGEEPPMDDMEGADDGSEGKKAAASKLIDSMKSGDASGVVAALSEFMDMHEMASEPDEDDMMPEMPLPMGE